MLLQIKQNTGYEFSFVDSIDATSLESINIDTVSEVEDKVSYYMTYSFDNSTWTPYSTDFVACLAQINIYSKTLSNKVYIKLKIVTMFNEQTDYIIINSISINDVAIAASKIRITELQYFRGITNDYTKNLFKPYDNLEASVDRMISQAIKINEIFGHDVYYIKVKEVKESLNSTFKEYEKFKVDSVKKIKVMIPDNDFKSNVLVYSEFNIEYQQDFELHIVIQSFEKAFGPGESPQAKDIIYIPQTTRMYEITSSQFDRQLNNVPVYNMCTARRYIASTDTDTSTAIIEDAEFDINSALTFDINDFEHSLGDAESDNKNNSPLLTVSDTNTISTGKIISDAMVEGINAQQLHNYHYLSRHEKIRQHVHKYAKIVNSKLTINNAPIFFRYYDLTRITNAIAIQYNSKKIYKAKTFNASIWTKLVNNCSLISIDNILVVYENSKLLIKQNNEILSSIDISSLDYWYFISINIYNEQSTIEFNVFKYDNVQQNFALLKEEFCNFEKLTLSNSTLSNVFVHGGSLISNVKIYAKAITNNDLVSLALDRMFSIEESVIIDTVFDLK
jgi:hypothetical protein